MRIRRLTLVGTIFCMFMELTSGAKQNIAFAQKKEGKDGPKHVFSGPPPAHQFNVILARPTDRSITLSVLANQDTEVMISYGLAKDELKVKTLIKLIKASQTAEFTLNELSANTRYYYLLHTKVLPATEFTIGAIRNFHTQRPTGSTFSFTLQADSHLDQGVRPAVYERTLANALTDRPDFHIDLGDTFMTDKYPNYQDALPQYVAQRYYLGQLAHSVPLFMVLGNHDGERLDRYNQTPDCMPVWSCLQRKQLFPNPSPDRFYSGNQTEMKHIGRLDNYYAWEWGDALLVALDPFWTTAKIGRNQGDGNWARTLGKEQYDWLKQTLERSTAKFKFVMIHHLVGGLDDSGRGGAEAAVMYEWGGLGKNKVDEFKTKRLGWEMPIHQLLVKHHVSAVFHGHDHFFADQELDGVAYVMVPQPGHPGGEHLKNAHEYGYIRGEFQPPAGHIRVKITPEFATIDYVRSYLPASETPQKKNGDVSFTRRLKPSSK